MANQMTGRVEAIDEVKAGNGGKALRVTLEGEQHPFYDWGRHVDEAEVGTGDTIRIEHNGSRYPRISAIEQVAAYEPAFESAGVKRPLTIHDKDRLIVRMSCMKTAVELLGDVAHRVEIAVESAEDHHWLGSGNVSEEIFEGVHLGGRYLL